MPDRGDHVVAAALALLAFAASLAYVVRPWPETAGPGPAATGRPLPVWLIRRYATWLCLARGGLNGGVAVLGLLAVGHPLVPSLAEGITAGLLSGFCQRPLINERFSAYLDRAPSEPARILK